MEQDQENFAQLYSREGKGLEPNTMGKDEPAEEAVNDVPANPLEDVAVSAECNDTSWGLNDVAKRKLNKLQLETKYDYHGRTREKAYTKLGQDLHRSLAQGLKVIEVVHGKGDGTLRLCTRGWLRACKWVVAFKEPRDNDGSVLVLLRHRD